MTQRLKLLLPILLLTLIPTFILWLPFLARMDQFWGIPLPTSGLATIVANFDGPLYIVIAKTFYNTDAIAQNFQFPLPNEYYAAHFPLYPIFIRLFAPLAGYTYSMLFTTLTSSFLALYFFYKFISQYTSKSNALWMTAVFSVLPARWLVVRSVGSPEPLFVASVIASIYNFQNRRYWKAGIWGALAQLVKSPGILLFLAYAATIIYRIVKENPTDLVSARLSYKKLTKFAPLLLIPLSLLGLFFVYEQTFGSFFAYFNSGDNIHLFFPPFQIFNYSAPWVGTFWLEEIIFIYALGILGFFSLIKLASKGSAKEQDKNAILPWFVGIFLLSIIFVSHRDVMRYALPIVPFIYAGWIKAMSSQEFKIVMAVIIIPIFLYSLAFISQNIMPISDWGPLL